MSQSPKMQLIRPILIATAPAFSVAILAMLDVSACEVPPNAPKTIDQKLPRLISLADDTETRKNLLMFLCNLPTPSPTPRKKNKRNIETPGIEDTSNKRICMDGNVNDDNNDGKNTNKTVETVDGKNKSSNCDEEKDSCSRLKKMCRLMNENGNAEDEIDMGNLLDEISEKEEEDFI